MKRKCGKTRILTKTLFALVCFAVLFLLAGPAYAEGTQIGTNVSIMVEENFEITAQTEDFTLAVGGSQELRITVSGISPFTYSWEFSTDGGASWSSLPGAESSPSYTITNAQANTPANLAYQYKVTVKNSANQSRSAVIRVLVSNDYEYRTSTDAASAADSPTVSGYLHDATVLHVDPIQPQTDLSTSVWTAMSAQIGTGETYIEPYNIYFTNSAGETVMYHGELEIKFYVGAAYNGMTLKAVHYHTPTGTVETLTGTVTDGVLAVTVHDLCPFMVVVPKSTAHVITASAGAGGRISPWGAVNVGHGGEMYFYFIPNSGYTLDKVLLDGVETAVTGNRYQFTNVTDNHTISASFKASPPPTTYYMVTASAGENGSISPTGSTQVAEGGAQTFSFMPNEGYEIDTLIVDGSVADVNGSVADVNGSSYRFTNIRENHTIHVTYKERSVIAAYHTIMATAGAGGKISPSGRIRVIESGDADFYFIPNEGYEVAEVLIDDVAVNITADKYRFEGVSAGHTIHVSFKETKPNCDTFFTVTVRAGEHGEISPTGELQVAEGGSQTFSVMPNAGYEVEAVYINGKKQEVEESSFTVDNITGDMEISVTFKPVETEPVGGKTGCRCLWGRLFGGCAICGLFGHCIAPWCWLIPLILLASAAALAIGRRRAQKRKTKI